MDIRHARSLRFAVLVSALVGASLASPAPRVVAQGVAECRDWVDSGSADTRFKVWACKGEDPAMADAAVAQVAALMDEIWGPMTQPAPTGMGEPLPDAVGTNVDLEHGRDARIDVYALLPGHPPRRVRPIG